MQNAHMNKSPAKRLLPGFFAFEILWMKYCTDISNV